MATSFYDRVKVGVVSAPGTGNVALGAATTGYRTFTDAGVSDGATVSYVIEDGASWELGHGTYAAATKTLTRTSISSTSAGGSAAVNFSASATVAITLLAADIASFGSGGSGGTKRFSARYWRLYNYNSSNGGAVSIAEFYLKDASGTKLVPTAVTGGPGLNSSSASAATDGDPSTFYDNNVTSTNFIELDFGAVVTPDTVSIQNRPDNYPQYNWSTGSLQCSQDNSTWVTTQGLVNPDTQTASKVYTVTVSSSS